MTNVTLIGALDDVHGRTVAVYQDHDGIRIDVAGIEIMLTCEMSRELREHMLSAEVDATVWGACNA